MSHLVAHDEQQLAIVHARDDGVPQDDPLGLPDARDIRIQRFGVDALVDLENAAALDARAVRQREDSRLQRLVAASARSR